MNTHDALEIISMTVPCCKDVERSWCMYY